MPGATNFPAALDTGIEVSAITPEDQPGAEHDVNHNNTWAAVLALQTKVGIDGSAEATSIDARVSSAEAAIESKADVGHTHAAGDITSGVFAAARISESSVTQHEAALAIGWGQLTGPPPALLVTSTFTVDSEAQQLALAADEGDIAIRSDENKSYAHNGGASGTMADWSLLQTPTDAVLSVAGKTGAVTLVKADVGLASVDNTSDADKPVSSATQTALDGKEASGAAAAAIAAHVSETDPHTQYLTEVAAAAGYQPLDGDLTALAGLASTGIVRRTGAGAASAGGAVTVAEGGSGVSTITGWLKGNGTSAFTGHATIPNTDISGLGTASTQADSSYVHIAGAETITGVKTFGIGGTGTDNALVVLNGSSASSYGAYIIIQRNSVNKALIGNESGINGGASDDLALYVPSGVNTGIYGGGVKTALVSATAVTITGAVSATSHSAIGVTPSTDWFSNRKSFEIGGNSVAALCLSSAASEVLHNARVSASLSDFVYANTGPAGICSFNNAIANGWAWQAAASGTGGTALAGARTQWMQLTSAGLAVATAISATTTVTAAKSFQVDDVHQLTAVTTAGQTRTLDLANGTVQTIQANQGFTVDVTGPSSKEGKIRLYIYNNGAGSITASAGNGWARSSPISAIVAGSTSMTEIEWSGAHGWRMDQFHSDSVGDYRPT